MSEQDDIQRQIATLRQDLAATQNESVRAFIQQQLDAAQRQLSVLLNQVSAPQSNLAIGNIVAGDLNQTVQIFFAGQPAPDERVLLDDYLRAVYADCERLRLDRLIARQHDGQERSLIPAALTLSDVYTALATDEEVAISRHPRCIILSRLRARLDERSADRVPAERVRSALLAKPDLHDLHDDERVIVGLYRPELALEAIARERRLVLLGDPGSGKSTALRYLAALLADAILRGRDSLPVRGWRDRALPIPLLCPLGLVAAEVERTGDRPIAALWRVLERLIEGEGGTRQGLGRYVREALRHGAVAVLFDGLDEIPVQSDGHALRASIADALREFARELPEATLAVTCRIRPYRELADWQLREEQGWSERILAPWAFGQVRRFIDRWYAATAEHAQALSAAEAATRAADLIAALENSDRLRALTESPLLATMLALVHLNRKTLPQDRAELYHECVELLLDRWEPARSWANRRPGLLERLAIPNLRREDLRAVLHAIAYQAHLAPPSADGRGLISDDQLQGQLLKFFLAIKVPPAEVVAKHRIFLAALREETGLLHDLDGVYALPHLTFEEYLAACHLADQPNLTDLAYERWSGADRERWREVLLLLMGRLRQQGKTARDGAAWVRHLGHKKIGRRAKPAEQRQRDALFAAECYAEMGGAAALAHSSEDIDEIEERLADGLAEILDTAPSLLPLPERIRAGELLGPLGDPRLLDPATGNSRDGKYWCDVEAGEFWFDLHPLAISPLEKMRLEYGFKLARFAVTNGEYQQFIDASGYENSAWWTPEGRDWKTRQSSFPATDKDLEATKNSFPVTSVSWYEAMAFCRWLTDQGYSAGWLEHTHEIRLLTYIEWERSARHTDQRFYPWGDDKPDAEHLNTLDFHDGYPTPVGCFIAGRAECGALDLLGNTETWLATNHRHFDSIKPISDVLPSEQVFTKQDDFFNYGVHQIGDILFTFRPIEKAGTVGFRLVMAPRAVGEG